MSVWAKLEAERVLPENPHCVIYRLSGALTDSKESYTFLSDLKADVKSGLSTAIVNLEKVERINSSGVGILCACLTSIKTAEGRFLLVGMSERNRILMEAVGIWDLLEHFDTEDAIQLD